MVGKANEGAKEKTEERRSGVVWEDEERWLAVARARMCIPFFILVPAGPHFPEFRIFFRISGVPAEHTSE